MYFSKQNNEFARLNHHILFHADLNVVLFLTPKAGNCTIKKAILQGMGYDLFHEYDAGFEFVTPQNVLELRDHRATKCVGFVRNPRSRIISCWKDKINNPKPEEQHVMKNWKGNFYKGMSFNDFIEEVTERTKPMDQDMHYRPQSHEMALEDEFLVDSIHKIENWSQEGGWEAVSDDLTSLGIPTTTPDHLNASSSVQPLMSERAKLLIDLHYFWDYQLFSYEYDYKVSSIRTA